MNKLTKALIGLVATPLALVGAIAASPAAQAATNCPTGKVCLYYSANMTGSYIAYSSSVATISGTYPTAGLSGYGQTIRNNAHSVYNNSINTVTVYVSPNYTGGYQTFGPGASGNLVSPVLNNEASVKVTAPPPTPTCASNAVCLFYSANMTGSFVSYTTSVGTISGTYPVAGLAGYGATIRNNAHSVINNTAYPVKIWVSPNYAGGSQTFAAHTSGNLVSPVLNNEASVQINPPAPQTTPTTTMPFRPANAVTSGSGWKLANNTNYYSTPCAAGSTQMNNATFVTTIGGLGTYTGTTNASGQYTDAGNGITIRVCYINADPNHKPVASVITANAVALFAAAKAAGYSLAINEGLRTYQAQQGYYTCYQQKLKGVKNPCNNGNIAATPGTSNHEGGTAMDLNVTAGSAAFTWLTAHAASYGFYNYKPEPWHWSTNGG